MKQTISLLFGLLLCCSVAFAAPTVQAPSEVKAPPIDDARSGCCSWHDGVCGCSGGRASCCDGTLSPSCGCLAPNSSGCKDKDDDHDDKSNK